MRQWLAVLLFASISPLSGQVRQLRAVPDSAFAAPDLELPWLRTLLVDSQDRVYVPDEITPVLYRLSADGHAIERVVRNGAGPGEANGIIALGWLADTLWFWDNRLARHTFLRQDGVVVRTENNGARCHNPSPQGILTGGRCFASVIPAMASQWREGDPIPIIPAVIVDPSQGTVDTIGAISYVHSSMQFDRADARSVVPQPYPDDPIFTGTRDGRAVLRVSRAAATSARIDTVVIEQWRSGRERPRRLAIPYRPRVLEGRTLDSALNVLGGRLKKQRRWVTVDSVQRKAFRPAFYPPVSSTTTASDGSLWLRFIEEAPSLATGSATWLVLTPNLTLSRRVTVPSNFRILDARGSLVWGAIDDEDDVPHVVRYRLVPE